MIAAVTEDNPKHVRSPLPTIGLADPRAGAEVNLRLLAGCGLHAAEGKRTRGGDALHEPPHAVVAEIRVFLSQVLMDAFRGETLLQLLQNLLAIRLALAPRWRGPGGPWWLVFSV